MEILNEIYAQVAPQINWVLILGIIALGEIVKRFWKTDNIQSFVKVLITTLPLTILYVWLDNVEILQSIVSYLLAFWLYSFFVKWILNIFGARSYSASKTDLIGGRPNDR